MISDVLNKILVGFQVVLSGSVFCYVASRDSDQHILKVTIPFYYLIHLLTNVNKPKLAIATKVGLYHS